MEKSAATLPSYRQTIVVLSLAALLGVWLISRPAAARSQNPFAGQAALFHADLSRYFANPEAEKSARLDLQGRTDAYLKVASWTPEDAAAQLDEGAKLLTEWMLHDVYCEARAARDVGDNDARTCDHDAANQYDNIQGFVDTQLRSKPIVSLRADELRRLDLQRFQYLLQQSRLTEEHSLTPEVRRALRPITGPLSDGWTDRYFATVRALKAAPIVTKNGPLDPIKDASKIAQDPDRSVREAGFNALQQAYDAHGELFAATLIDIVREQTGLAKLRSFPDAPSRIYASRLQLTEPQVHATLDALTQHADVLKDYQRVRAEQVGRVTGLSDVRSWDMALSSGYVPKAVPFAQARITILKALAPLGQDYMAQFGWLLDPKNGALEIAGGPHRQSGGFSLGFPGVPAMLYVEDYNGTLSAEAVVIHEGGHAINRKIMSDAGVSPFYATGPKFLMEAYAILNEFLLWDELERESTSPAEKAYFQERLLDKVTFEVFTSAEEATLEQGIYDGVPAGKINDENDLDSLNAKILDQYELFSADEPELRKNWTRKRLLFEDPLYLVNYLYAALVACKFYEMDKANPDDFQRRYNALLREGFDAPAADLIQKNMGLTLDSDELLSGALQLMQRQTAELRKTYQSLPH
jgi:oligoendopeptidase F